MPNFDRKKTRLEKNLEHVANILATTHPEQTSDAMDDYAKALRVLEGSKDFRVQLLIDQLKRLYIYPNRPEHKKMLVELYDIKESLYETRMDNIKDPKDTAALGEEINKPKQWPWILLTAIALFILLR